MAGKGRMPKPAHRRAGHSKDPHPVREVELDVVAEPPDLPDGFAWHPQTRAWWETWRASPLMREASAVDWEFLVDTAICHDMWWTTGLTRYAAELRLRVAKFGATPEDRLRLRITATEGASAGGGAAPGLSARERYRGLRPVVVPLRPESEDAGEEPDPQDDAT